MKVLLARQVRALAAGCALLPFSLLGASRTTGAQEGAAQAAAAALSPAVNRSTAPQLLITIRDDQPGLVLEPGANPGLPAGGPGYRGSAYARRMARQLATEYGLTWVTEWYIDPLHVHCVVFTLQDSAARDALIVRLQKDRRIDSVQAMQMFATSSSDTAQYNDPYFSVQQAIQTIGVPQAQRRSQGRGVRVAVIDTGVDDRHPDLAGRVEATANFVDGDSAQFRRDRHGTAVAGAIAAVANNQLGIVGVAPAVRLLALKACWQLSGDPQSGAVCNSLTLALALAFAIEHRAQIVNLSLTGPGDALLERLVTRALQLGIVVVGADLRETQVVSFPLTVKGVIAVADADSHGATAAASRDNPQGRNSLLAPGRQVFTLAPGGQYAYVSGTSMSVALVSGVAALLAQSSDAAHLVNIRERLLRTASAAGIVNACNAVLNVAAAPGCSADQSARTALTF